MATEKQIEAVAWVFLHAAYGNAELVGVFPGQGHMETARAAIDAAERAAWQPIETAPKDGTCILAWSEMWEGTISKMVVWWDEDQEGWLSEHADLSEWSEDELPTHWCRLPATPVQS